MTMRPVCCSFHAIFLAICFAWLPGSHVNSQDASGVQEGADTQETTPNAETSDAETPESSEKKNLGQEDLDEAVIKRIEIVAIRSSRPRIGSSRGETASPSGTVGTRRTSPTTSTRPCRRGSGAGPVSCTG